MKELFTRYIGQKIGLNFKEIGKFHATVLVAVHDEYFSVRAPEPTDRLFPRAREAVGLFWLP